MPYELVARRVRVGAAMRALLPRLLVVLVFSGVNLAVGAAWDVAGLGGSAGASEELCRSLTSAAMAMNNSRNSAEDIRAWGSWSAMAVLGSIECAEAFPPLRPVVMPWVGWLLDGFLAPGKPADKGIKGAMWRSWCDKNGVPPALFVAAHRGTTRDRAAIDAFANQTLTYAAEGKMQGAGVLPDGAVARSTSGRWKVPPLPRGNATQITWPDDTFMCTAMLTHAAPVLASRVAGERMLDEAARRLLGVFHSNQRDVTDGLLWHGFDVATGLHSCCKWGDGNGWLLMALADAVRGFQRLNYTAAPGYGRVVSAFREFAAAWAAVQDHGQWHQLLSDNTTYFASSAGGFGVYALAQGLHLGVLDETQYTTVVKRGWQALTAQVLLNGTVAGLSPGFGILASRAEYIGAGGSFLWGYGAVIRACAAVGRWQQQQAAQEGYSRATPSQLLPVIVPAAAAVAAAMGPRVQSAEEVTGVKAVLTFSTPIVLCEPAGMELLVSSSSANTSNWVAANVALRNGQEQLTLLAPDGPAGCEQTLSAVRFTHKCPTLQSWNKSRAEGPCKPSAVNCSVYDARGAPLLPFVMNLTSSILAHYQVKTDDASSSSFVRSNMAPILDDRGQLLNAHETQIVRWSEHGPWYMYAMKYALCRSENNTHGCAKNRSACDFRTDHNMSVFTSATLAPGSWHWHSDILPADLPPAAYFRGKVLYNRIGALYVLWIFGGGNLVVCSSASPVGPFELRSIEPSQRGLVQKTGDLSFFINADEIAYIIFNANFKGIEVQQLAPNYLSSLGPVNGMFSSGVFGTAGTEAPVLFQRQGVTYALFGKLCCVCGAGSGVEVWTSTTGPLGNYTFRGQIGRDVESNVAITHAQQAWVLQLPRESVPEWIWIGDRWGSAVDGLHGHDLSYWQPLDFADDGSILPFATWHDSIAVTVQP